MRAAKHILKQVLSERTAMNPSYSLRAFARDLELSPQQLSNVINGKRGLGPDLAKETVVKLGLDPIDQDFFLESLKAQFSKSKTQRIVSQAKLKSLERTSSAKNLEIDLFKIISNWYHLAIVELIKITPKKKQTETWFSRKLNVPGGEVGLALERLERLELITKTLKGWIVNQDTLIVDKGISAESIKHLHQQILEKSIQALSFQTGEERYGSSSMVPIKVKDLGLAKKMIQDFRMSFAQNITDSEQGEEIYALGIQFFRLSNNGEVI